MKKLSKNNQLGWLGRSMLGGSIAVASTTYALDLVGFNLPPGFLTASPFIGISFTSFYWYLYQLDLLVYRPRKNTSFAYSVNRIVPMDDPDMQTTLIDIPLNEPLEFIFSHPELPVDISLSRLAEFLGAGCRRQRRATSKDEHRFLISQAWAMGYYINGRYGAQQFIKNEVLSCRIIITVANKWSRKPAQGFPGSLSQHTIYKSHHRLADDIMTIWKRRTGYKPPLSQGWIDRTKRRLKRLI